MCVLFKKGPRGKLGAKSGGQTFLKWIDNLVPLSSAGGEKVVELISCFKYKIRVPGHCNKTTLNNVKIEQFQLHKWSIEQKLI